jgi:hypothetical protein
MPRTTIRSTPGNIHGRGDGVCTIFQTRVEFPPSTNQEEMPNYVQMESSLVKQLVYVSFKILKIDTLWSWQRLIQFVQSKSLSVDDLRLVSVALVSVPGLPEAVTRRLTNSPLTILGSSYLAFWRQTWGCLIF